MPVIPGAIGAFRRQVLVDAGGVPADTLAEDTDLTMAVLRAGWQVTYEERAIAWTEAPRSLRQPWRQRYRWCYGTMQAMWSLPLQQFVYRQVMYLVVVQSVVTVLLGTRLRWHRMVRTGDAAALIRTGTGPGAR